MELINNKPRSYLYQDECDEAGTYGERQFSLIIIDTVMYDCWLMLSKYMQIIQCARARAAVFRICRRPRQLRNCAARPAIFVFENRSCLQLIEVEQSTCTDMHYSSAIRRLLLVLILHSPSESLGP